MNVIVLASIVVRFIAVAVSVRIFLRIRDFRILLLTAMLLLTVARQFLGDFDPGSPDAFGLAGTGVSAADWLFVLVSLVSLPCVYYLGRLIDERQSALTAHAVSECRLKACIDTSPNVAMQWFDEDGRITFWNQASERTYGWPASEVMGKRLNELIFTEETERKFEQLLAEARATGKSIGPIEFPFTRRDGKACICSSSIFEVSAQDGRSIVACMDVDITDQRQIEADLRRRESQMRLFVEYAPAAVALLDCDLRYLAVSQRWREDYRLGDQDIIGKTHYEVFPEVPERWKEIHRRCLSGAIEKCEEDIFPRADGKIDWLRWEIRPWELESGERGGIVMFTELLTDRMQAREALRQSEQRFRLLVENLEVIAWEGDPSDRRFTFVTGQPERITGFTAAEWYAPGFWMSRIHPEDRDRALSESETATAGGIAHDFEYRFVRKDGSEVWIHDYVTVEMDSGNPVRLRGIMVDVTAAHSAMEKLERSEARLRDTIEAVSLGFWEMDVATQRLTLSPEWYALLGYAAGDFPSTFETVNQLVHPEDRHETTSRFDAFIADPSTPLEHQFRIRHRDGTYRWWLSRGYAVRTRDGRASLVRGVNIDISADREKSEALRLSEERFRGIADHGSVGFWQISLDRRSIYANPAMIRMLEVDDAAELSSLRVDDFFDEQDRQRIIEELRQRGCGNASTYEVELVGRKGTRRRVLICGVPLRDPYGEVRGSIGTFTDITAMRQAEQEAREFRESLERAQAVGQVGSWWFDVESKSDLKWSPHTHRMFGLAESEFDGRVETFFRLVHPDDRALLHEKLDAAIAGMGRYSIDHRIVKPDGDAAWIHEEADVIWGPDGRASKMIGICQDITDRKQAEDLGQIRSFMLDRLTSGRPLPEILEGIAHIIERIRPGVFCSILLLDERGRRLRHGAAPSLPDFYNKAVDGLEIGEGVGSCGTSAFRGQPVVAEDIMNDPQWAVAREVAQKAGLGCCWSYPIMTAGRKVLGTFALYRASPGGPSRLDTELIETSAHFVSVAIERKRAEAALAQSEERYRALISATATVVWTTDSEGRFVTLQPAWEAYSGQTWEQYRGTGWVEALHIDDREQLLLKWKNAVANASFFEAEGRFWHSASGEYHHAVSRGVPLLNEDGSIREWVGSITDIDARKRAEEAVQAAQSALIRQQEREKARIAAELARARDELVLKTRLATIGQVSASIAHELRNPLGAIRNAAYFLKRRSGDTDEKLTQYLNIIETEVATSDRIITNLMEMTRARLPDKQPVNLGQIIDSVLGNCRAPDNVSIRRQLRPDPFIVFADSSQIRQVLENLITNAIQALDGAPGSVSIDALQQDDYDVFVVRDSGVGVPPEARPLLFEPLFTTKAKAKGTGLGLTICRQLIERHGGVIEYLDDGQRGTAFHVRLPRAQVFSGESI
ncbi:MAG: PAS domain S-box protein [Phycisphaerae bacterium]|nr:PAS domain S-box protein [Phycisphaerae bacterium]